MRASQKLIPIGLLTLATAALVGLFLTGRSSNTEVTVQGGRVPAAAQEPLVDQQTLGTAQKLAVLAATSEEVQLARDAARVADHEVDLDFAGALRRANHQPGSETGEIHALRERIRQIEAQIKADEAKVKQLTAQAASAKEGDQENLQTQIELAQAELALDQDEVADAQEDLVRAGGDERSRLQRLVKEHESAQHANEGTTQSNSRSSSPADVAFSQGSLLAHWSNWRTLAGHWAQLLQAKQDALNNAAALSRNHDALERHVGEEQSQKQALAAQAASLLKADKTESDANSKQAAASALSSLHRLSADEKSLADLDKRIQDLRELGAIYDRWSASVERRERASLHDLIKSALWIILTVLAVVVLDRLIDRSLTRITLEHKQQITLRGITRFTVQVLAVLAILLVIFGSPNQVSTILGLAGAGLTVALKDFIVSFFGWFVLMGRNGIRVGDWVEINGVRGEVIEVGLLRTVLFETGNWTSLGQLTGRQVAFLNSFAVEGHYFNFTTSGQWLWDEIQVLIPWGVDPSPIIEKISEMVETETEQSARTAEQEWQHATRRYGVKPFSATPTANVRSTDEGVQVVVRYITRASQRAELRSRLHQAAVELIHQGKARRPEAEALPASSGAGANDINPG